MLKTELQFLKAWAFQKSLILEMPLLNRSFWEKNNVYKFSRRGGVPLLAVITAGVVWQALTAWGTLPAYILPPPSSVFTVLFSDFSTLWSHTLVSLQATFLGLGIALVFAVILSFVMKIVPIVGEALYPLLVVSQTVPLIALAPLFVVWFGFGLLPKVLVVTLVCFFPIVVSLLKGVDTVDQERIDLLRAMGASDIQLFTVVYLPASLPHLFGGLRISATYSVMGAVIGEWLGGTNGLGVYMVRAQKAFALHRVFAAIAVIVTLSLAIFAVVVAIERAATPWLHVSEPAARTGEVSS